MTQLVSGGTALRALIAAKVPAIAFTPSGPIVRSSDDIALHVLSLPEVAAIVDLAASHYLANGSVSITPEVRELLKDWQTKRADS